jgi:hypothetical protein
MVEAKAQQGIGHEPVRLDGIVANLAQPEAAALDPGEGGVHFLKELDKLVPWSDRLNRLLKP